MDINFKKLVEDSKGNNEALANLIYLFEPKINYCLQQTTPSNKQDMKQDLIIKMIYAIKKYDINSVPGFWDMQKKFHSN